MDAAIAAKGLCKHYHGHAVVDRLDVEISPGSFCGFLGPNGAGKTTFLRILIGNTPPSEGSLHVLGYRVPEQARPMRALIGVVPQEDNLDPDFTVVENLAMFAGYFGIKAGAFRSRQEELLEFASLTTRQDARIDTLSGGMRRRLSLARALINDPQLLVLDEPTTGLDPQARQMMWQRLRDLKRRGKTLVLTTHYMEEAQRLCDRVIIMDHGRILDDGAPDQLIHRHIEAHVVEVNGPGLDNWHSDHGHRATRCEEVGETRFYYTRDERSLLGALERSPQLTFLHRPASLEDVFLKLTGRDLRDA